MKLLSRINEGNTGFLNLLVIFGIALLAFGYYISASAAILVDIPSRPINLAYRAVTTICILIPLFFIPQFKRNFVWPEVLFFSFWSIYLLRLVFDTLILGVTYNNTFNTGLTIPFIFLVLIFNIIIPSIIVFAYRNFISIDTLVKYFVIFILISNCFVFYSVVTSKQYLESDYLYRIALGADDENTLNPIRISLIGAISVCTSVFWLVFKKIKLWLFLFLSAMIGVGFFNLLVGGSRGPLSICLIALILIAIYYLNYRKTIIRFLKFFIIGLIVLSSATVFIIQNLEEFVVFNRINETLENVESGKKEERNELFSIAWNMFLDNPIIGTQFITSDSDIRLDRVIPHNILLESLMATGIFGSIFLFILLALQLKIIISIGKYSVNQAFIIILAAIFYLQALISGSIFLEIDFFILMSLCLTFRTEVRQNKAVT